MYFFHVTIRIQAVPTTDRISTELENGTITPKAVEQQYYMTKFEKLDELHTNEYFKVEVIRTGKTQWRTYVGKGKTRKLVSAAS